MTKPTYVEVIAHVRATLKDDGKRISPELVDYRLAWWPGAKRDFFETLLGIATSDSTGDPEIMADYEAEVAAIATALDALDPLPPDLDSWSKVNAQANRRASVLNTWEKIAVPIRRKGDVLFHISAPVDIFGTPTVKAVSVDDYMRATTAVVGQQLRANAARIKRLEDRVSAMRVAIGFMTFLLIASLFGREEWLPKWGFIILLAVATFAVPNLDRIVRYVRRIPD